MTCQWFGGLCVSREKSTTCFTWIRGPVQSVCWGLEQALRCSVKGSGIWPAQVCVSSLVVSRLWEHKWVSETLWALVFPICKMRKVLLISISYCAVRIKSRTRGKCFAQSLAYIPKKSFSKGKLETAHPRIGTKLTQFPLLQGEK